MNPTPPTQPDAQSLAGTPTPRTSRHAGIAISHPHFAPVIVEMAALETELTSTQQALTEARRERDAHIAIALSCGQSTVEGLKQSLLREMRLNNEKDRPPGFDSWEAYHAHIVAQGRELVTLRQQNEALRREGEADKARLDWLEVASKRIKAHREGDGEYHTIWHDHIGNTLRQSIDAARAAQQAEGKQGGAV